MMHEPLGDGLGVAIGMAYVVPVPFSPYLSGYPSCQHHILMSSGKQSEDRGLFDKQLDFCYITI
jgi:hypothetical protein